MTDVSATVSTPTEGERARGPCIAARVLAHPDPARVGEFVPLFDDDDSRGRIAISRLAPALRTRDGRLAGPLASPRITRSPLEIERVPGGLKLRFDAASPAVEVNGQPLQGQRMVSNAELGDGLIVLAGRDLTLWIGWLDLTEPSPDIGGLVGESTAMRKLRRQILSVAALDVHVLLRGATGVGKEMVAGAIHAHSRRAQREYVAVNVAGIPPTMAASELFGHKRGAFTGAAGDHKGYFAEADGGTLLLDEIGDASPEVQALLLRAVEKGVIQPVGGIVRQVDVRLIAATDADLEAAVARREFREPLLRRFPYEIHIPPLRARRDDIGMLFFHLLRGQLGGMGAEQRLSPAGDREPWVPAAFVADLARHDWPGNVRELANVALAFAVENRDRARGRVSDELKAMVRPARPAAGDGAPAAPATPAKRSGDLREEDLVAALRAEGWSWERAAKRLNVSKSHLYKRLAGVIRLAQEIPAEEIRAALAGNGGDVATAAERLRVSARALRLHMRRAGIRAR